MRSFIKIFATSLGMLGLTFCLWAGAFVTQTKRCDGLENDLERRIFACNWLVGQGFPDWGNSFVAAVYVSRGDAYEDLSDFESALASYQIALSKAPTDPSLHSYLGYFHYAQKRYQKALTYFESSIAIDPGSDISHIRKGDALRHMEMYSEAIESYSRAIELRTEYTEPYNARGWIYLKTGQLQLAESDFTTSITMDDLNPYTFYRRGWVNFKLGNKVQSKADFEKAKLLRPGTSWTWYGDIKKEIQSG